MHRCSWVWILCFLTAGAWGAETFAPEPASGPPTLTASYPIDGQPASAIGELSVQGAGKVTFFAHRMQSRLVLKAVGADGSQIGRAESLFGLGDTPIYIRTPKGLYKILVHWKP
jgi:hypothetical protein